ncbi:MAG: hypothetical protein WAO98_04190 [Alphaproteobacteria bacterium]
MDDKVAYWASVALSALALLLLVINVALVNGNGRLTAEVNQRQATINNAVGFSQINQALVQALADASVKENDKSIKDLLNSQGITVKPKADADADAAKE